MRWLAYRRVDLSKVRVAQMTSQESFAAFVSLRILSDDPNIDAYHYDNFHISRIVQILVR